VTNVREADPGERPTVAKVLDGAALRVDHDHLRGRIEAVAVRRGRRGQGYGTAPEVS
jgi:hypothetical protein